MAESGVRTDPFRAFRFEVRIDDLAVGGFSECSGLQLETEVQDYAEGGLNSHLHRFPGRTRQANLTLRRGVVDRTLWDWYWDLTQGKVRARNASVVLHDEAGTGVAMEFQLRAAFPCKWVGPELNALQSAVAIESLELSHRGMERRR